MKKYKLSRLYSPYDPRIVRDPKFRMSELEQRQKKKRKDKNPNFYPKIKRSDVNFRHFNHFFNDDNTSLIYDPTWYDDIWFEDSLQQVKWSGEDHDPAFFEGINYAALIRKRDIIKFTHKWWQYPWLVLGFGFLIPGHIIFFFKDHWSNGFKPQMLEHTYQDITNYWKIGFSNLNTNKAFAHQFFLAHYPNTKYPTEEYIRLFTPRMRSTPIVYAEALRRLGHPITMEDPARAEFYHYTYKNAKAIRTHRFWFGWPGLVPRRQLTNMWLGSDTLNDHRAEFMDLRGQPSRHPGWFIAHKKEVHMGQVKSLRQKDGRHVLVDLYNWMGKNVRLWSPRGIRAWNLAMSLDPTLWNRWTMKDSDLWHRWIITPWSRMFLLEERWHREDRIRDMYREYYYSTIFVSQKIIPPKNRIKKEFIREIYEPFEMYWKASNWWWCEHIRRWDDYIEAQGYIENIVYYDLNEFNIQHSSLPFCDQPKITDDKVYQVEKFLNKRTRKMIKKRTFRFIDKFKKLQEAYPNVNTFYKLPMFSKQLNTGVIDSLIDKTYGPQDILLPDHRHKSAPIFFKRNGDIYSDTYSAIKAASPYREGARFTRAQQDYLRMKKGIFADGNVSLMCMKKILILGENERANH